MTKWFAWYPVNIDNEWVWLKSVYRVRRYVHVRPGGEYPSPPVIGYWIYSQKENG